MRLYIDTSSAEKIVISIDDKKYETVAHQKASQMLLSFIDETLNKLELKLQDFKEINVNTGPGSFTGLRVGVSVANTLGWALKIPVNGKKVTVSSVDIQYN